MDLILIPFIAAICIIIVGYLIKNNSFFLKKDSTSESNDVISLETGGKIGSYLIIYGLIILISVLIGWTFSREKYVLILFSISLPIAIISLPLISYNIHKKYNLQSNGKVISIVAGCVTIVISGFLFFILREPQVTIDDKAINIVSTHSHSIPLNLVKEVRLIDVIPPKMERNEGFDIFGVSRGKFKLEAWNEVDLYLQSQHSPYIYIEMTSGRKVIFNSADEEKTTDYYQDIIEVNNYFIKN